MPTGRDSTPPPWLIELSDSLFREMMERLAGIRMVRQEGEALRPWDIAMSARIEGTYQALLMFQAERGLIRRLTKRMMGTQEVTVEDEEVYAQELLNIVCGHLLSGIYRRTRMPARFYPPRLMTAREADLAPAPGWSLLYVGVQGEKARLSWSGGGALPAEGGD